MTLITILHAIFVWQPIFDSVYWLLTLYEVITISPLPQSGGTALLYAGWRGHSEVVRLLLQAGARDIPNKVGEKQISNRCLL